MLIAGVLASIEERGGPEGTEARCSRTNGSPARRLCSPWRACLRRPPSAGGCGSRAICPSSPTSARCSRIATWADTRSRCRTSSTSPAHRSRRLRLPATIAAVALLIGPALGWVLRVRRKHLAATISMALTSAVFLIAAHIAFARFEPMLSSKQLADTIVSKGSPADSFIIYGDQSDASSVVFYTHNFLHKPAYIVSNLARRTATVRRCCGVRAIPTRPTSFSATSSCQRCGEPASANGSSRRTTNQPKAEQLLAGRLYSGAVHRRQGAVDRPAAAIAFVAFLDQTIRDFH